MSTTTTSEGRAPSSLLTLERPDTVTFDEVYHLTDEDFESFFSTYDELRRGCQRRDTLCDREAVVKTWWSGDKNMPEPVRDGCGNSLELCQPCFELFSHPSAKIMCAECEKRGHIRFKRIVWSESLK